MPESVKRAVSGRKSSRCRELKQIEQFLATKTLSLGEETLVKE